MSHQQRREVQAYAKIVGADWDYYMTKPRITLGRGGNGVDCDVLLSKESAVSRRHFAIRFAPEHQAIEIENFSKNGLLVNGDFVPRFSPPVLLRSQAEIAYGKFDSMRVTLILPAGTPMSSSVKHRAKTKYVPVTDVSSPSPSDSVGVYANGHSAHTRGAGADAASVAPAGARPFLPLVQWVGVLLAATDPLTPETIRSSIRIKYRRHLAHWNDVTLANSIRHVLTQNDHLFHVVDPGADYLAAREKGGADGQSRTPVSAANGVSGAGVAKFSVRPEERGRFIQFAQTVHARENGNA